MIKKLYACPDDRRLSETTICDLCGGATSKVWSGYFHVLEPLDSELAKEMNITKPGMYAMSVN